MAEDLKKRGVLTGASSTAFKAAPQKNRPVKNTTGTKGNGNFSNQLSAALSQFGAAISPPGSFGERLGKSTLQQLQNEAFRRALEGDRSGLNLLTPEQAAMAENVALARRRQGTMETEQEEKSAARERGLDIEEETTESRADYYSDYLDLQQKELDLREQAQSAENAIEQQRLSQMADTLSWRKQEALLDMSTEWKRLEQQQEQFQTGLREDVRQFDEMLKFREQTQEQENWLEHQRIKAQENIQEESIQARNKGLVLDALDRAQQYGSRLFSRLDPATGQTTFIPPGDETEYNQYLQSVQNYMDITLEELAPDVERLLPDWRTAQPPQGGGMFGRARGTRENPIPFTKEQLNKLNNNRGGPLSLPEEGSHVIDKNGNVFQVGKGGLRKVEK